MLNIIYGYNRAEKSLNVYQRVKQDLEQGRKVVLIVPEQTVLETERTLCELGVSSLSCQVLSLRRLCNMLFREYGGLCYNYISKAGKHAAMWRTVKELSSIIDGLTDSTLKDAPLLSMLVSSVEEMQMSNINADALSRSARMLDENDPLRNTLEDLSQIYALYTHIVAEKYDDPADDISAGCEKLAEHRYFENRFVYFDGFSGFTPAEAELVGHIIAQSPLVSLTLGYVQGDRREQFDRLRKTDKTLRFLAGRKNIKVISENCDIEFASDEAEFISRNLWSYSGKKYSGGDKPECVKVIRCSSKQRECSAVADEIRKKVMSGAQYKDFAVIARNPSEYRGLLISEFEKRDLPYFMSQRTDIKAKSQIRLLLSALALKVYNWQSDDVISYIKSGLCLENEDDADMLCEYIRMWNISGKLWTRDEEWRMNPEGFGAEYTEGVLDKLALINELRFAVSTPLVSFFDAFGRDSSVRDICRALFVYLKNLGLCERIKRDAEKKREQGKDGASDEDLQLWNSIIDTLDSMVDICGDMRISAEEFMKLFSLMLDSVDIGKIPSGTDEITVAGADMFRKRSQKYVYVLGLNEGAFPSVGKKSGILKERDRERLEEIGIELIKSREEVLCDEMLHFYNLVTSAENEVCLLYNDSTSPSICIDALCTLFERELVINYSEIPEKDRVSSAMTAFEYALGDKNDPTCKEILAYLAHKDERFNISSDTLSNALVTGSCSLDKITSDRISGKGIKLSQSKVEQYVNCPFSYFCKYVVHLKPAGSSQMESNDIGNYVHKVLEIFFKTVCGRDFSTITPEEIDSITDSIIEDYKSLILAGNEADKRTLCLFERLASLSKLMIRNLVAEFSVSEFRPVLFEQGMMVDSSMPELLLALDDDTKVSMNGYIDRVDTYVEGDNVYIRIVDYKTGSKKFSLSDIEKGLNLQMLIYLFALCYTDDEEIKKKLSVGENGKRIPAGVLYFLASAPSVASSDEPESPEKASEKVMKSIKRSGVLIDDIHILEAMEKELSGMFLPLSRVKSGNLSSNPPVLSLEGFDNIRTKVLLKVKEISEDIRRGRADADPYSDKSRDACKFCDMKSVCRRDINSKSQEDDDSGED